ncbi:MAG TPA: 5-methyltetrahydropteroyltriglutamate--homocysteine S-methyltransferase [Luteibacter sp.]|nr:5-methyltetrahydropteroyltriglutamate--homocysteine S-methyltransferase [Luteibacter sp.]
MTSITYLGFPRVGRRRELKRALESYWRGESGAEELHATGATLRRTHWQAAVEAGADVVPVNDFSLYDHVLDMAVLLGAIPDRYRALIERDETAGYFAMARGHQRDGLDLPALEMTKWFDTNYHYLVPELHAGQGFALDPRKPLGEYAEAKALGLAARPVLLGPVSFLLLSKTVDGSDALDLLDRLLPVYEELLALLDAAGVREVQLDEPCLVLDLHHGAHDAYRHAYAILGKAVSPDLLLATYFGGIAHHLPLIARLPVAGLHVDLARAPEQLDEVLASWPKDRMLSLGIVDGRNVWRSDPEGVHPLLARALDDRGPSLLSVAPSCSLLHVPVDLASERHLAQPLRGWLSFALQKIAELRMYVDAVNGDDDAIGELDAQRGIIAQRRTSPEAMRRDVRARTRQLTAQSTLRRSAHAQRRLIQAERFGLPLLPTTTIGSFPQTDTLRNARAANRVGKLSDQDYERLLEDEIRQVVAFQERAGIDVLVHGEPERNDMVEYFGEQLEGYAFTQMGWVQSYGSRCVKPPIIFGDVARPHAMTVRWSSFAQSLTARPMKGMLTGPVTMLQWAFVRDDLPRADVCRQIALALRDEVCDLETAGIGIVQIDEPALREGLPLRRGDWAAYLDWAVQSFRITAGGVSDATQIHTHMCYSEFNDIIEAVAAMDADVISIETSRSRMELLDAFTRYRYPNGIGPGVYDIHSPRIPGREDMTHLLRKALEVLAPDQLWVNPDCGLKTRGWAEVEPALEAMVAAARELRRELAMTA